MDVVKKEIREHFKKYFAKYEAVWVKYEYADLKANDSIVTIVVSNVVNVVTNEGFFERIELQFFLHKKQGGIEPYIVLHHSFAVCQWRFYGRRAASIT